MKTIKRIRFISAIMTIIAFVLMNTDTIFAANIESYVNASTFMRFTAFITLIALALSIFAFIISSVYIIVKE